jgi:malonyl-CoA O-methyltransferase
MPTSMIEPQALQVDKHRVRYAFEKSAACYDSVAVLQQEVARRMLERLELIRIKPATLADIGCGTGQIARALLQRYRGARVIALDIALSMARMADAVGSWLRKPLAVCGDAESLPLANMSLDMICSNLMLHWCNDLNCVLYELHRALAPGGLLLMTTLGPDTLKELRTSWAEVDSYVHVNGFADMHDVGDALLRAGFANPVIDLEMIRLTYPDARQLMRELKLLGAHNSTHGRARGLTSKDRLQRVLQAYERFRTPEGVLPASFEVIYAHAWAAAQRQSTS